MFDFLTNSIDNALSVASDLIDGDVDRRKVAKLMADGLTLAAALSALGYADDVIERVVSECEDK